MVHFYPIFVKFYNLTFKIFIQNINILTPKSLYFCQFFKIKLLNYYIYFPGFAKTTEINVRIWHIFSQTVRK